MLMQCGLEKSWHLKNALLYWNETNHSGPHLCKEIIVVILRRNTSMLTHLINNSYSSQNFQTAKQSKATALRKDGPFLLKERVHFPLLLFFMHHITFWCMGDKIYHVMILSPGSCRWNRIASVVPALSSSRAESFKAPFDDSAPGCFF